jgi:carbonic anhydrase
MGPIAPRGPVSRGPVERAEVVKRENEKILEELLEGNRRFFEGNRIHPHESAERRREVAGGQHPAAVLLTCSDSRVPPEILFDRGLGDLFVVRTAGNVVDDSVLGSIEYAVVHLGVRLIVVLGHSNCGAVGAALAKAEAKGHLNFVTMALHAAVDEVRHIEGDIYDLASRRNVELTVAALKSSEPILAPLNSELEIVGCYYDLDSGRIQVVC